MPRNPDRTDLCFFTYADGRRCTLPQFPDDMGLCYHHRQDRSAYLESREAGRQVASFLQTDILTACDLSCALSALFGATAMGYIKPKTASTLAYLAQLMLQTQQRAKHEYLETYETTWPKVVSEGPAFNHDDSDSAEPSSASATDLPPFAETEPPSAEPGPLPTPAESDSCIPHADSQTSVTESDATAAPSDSSTDNLVSFSIPNPL